MPSTLMETLIESSLPAERFLTSEKTAEKCRVCLLDFLAAAAAGISSPAFPAIKDIARFFGQGNSTLIGRCCTSSPVGAAFHNGIIGHSQELDDSHRYVSGLHLGVTVIPAALALAEEINASGNALMKAMVIGAEIAGRLCRCMDYGHRTRGFHATGTIGVFGAAAACSSLLRHDQKKMSEALGIAASASAGLFAFLESGATVKLFHAGRAASDGLAAAYLADRGFTAPCHVLEAPEGFFHAYAVNYDVGFITASLPEPEISAQYVKLHSACGHSFPAIDAALILRKYMLERGLTSENIRSISYSTYRNAAVLKKISPASISEARFSIPFVMALAIIRGHVDRADLNKDVLSERKILALSKLITVNESRELTASFPKSRPGVLLAAFSDGTRKEVRVDVPRGMPDNPASAYEIKNKFFSEANGIWGLEKAEQIALAVHRLDTLKSIRELTMLL